MSEIFGLQMTYIMVVLVALFSVCLLSVAYVAIRYRLVFLLGLRNIPRRPAQSALVVVGLMLSSLIITAALVTGDTIDRSITTEVYEQLGPIDEAVSVDIGDEAATRDQLFFDDTVYTEFKARMEGNPDIDGLVPGLFDQVNSFSTSTRLSEPNTTIMGIDPVALAEMEGFEGHRAENGRTVQLRDLREGEAFINADLADNLEIGEGDTVSVFALGHRTDFQVQAVVADTLLGGSFGEDDGDALVSITSPSGIVVPLTVAQELTDRHGQLAGILVSNRGDDRSGLDVADEVVSAANPALAGALEAAGYPKNIINPGVQPELHEVKQEGLDDAEAAGNVFLTIFVLMGLFSIGAGMLLIFLIFVMLAAERRAEMGMARAVGMRRNQLVQMFTSEGFAYDIGAAFVGTTLGIGVAFLMVAIMVSALGVPIPISYYASVRSVVVALCLAMSLTFITIFVSSINVSRLNIVAAISGNPSPTVEAPHNRRAITVALLLTLVLIGLAAFPIALLVLTTSALGPLGLLLAAMLLAAGALIPTRPRAVVVRLAGRGLGEYRGLVLSTLGLVIGGLMFVAGLSAHSDPLYTFGFSLLVVCVVFYMANATSLSPRLLWTAASLLLLWFWLTPGDVLQRIVGKMDGDIEMFFVSGVWVVAATTLLLIYNADLMLKAIHAVGGRFARILPALDMAVVYPLANRLRTGLTLAMFSLIMFSLVFMAVIQASYLEAFGSRDAAGHWDVLVTTSPNTQINDLRAAVDESGGDSSALETVGQVTLATLFGTEVRQETFPGDPGADPGEPGVVGLWGGDREFLENNRMPIQIRAEGYDTSQEVWAALADDPSLAVVDHSWVAVEGFGEETPIRLEGVDRDATIMKPVDLAVTNPQGGPPTRLKVIGVIDTSVLLVRGLFTSQEAVSALYGEGDLQQFFVRLEEGTDDREAANDIEASLFEQGIQSESLNEVLDEFTAEGRGFLYLMEGFMSLGLLVGVASLGVISLRAVVERRQQIGMLRAIGFRRALVSTTFILESAFVSLAGVAAGVITSLVLAYNVLNSQYAGGAADIPYTVPVDQVILFSSLAVIASLLMTWLAAARASRVPVAEALRYE